MPQIAVTGMTVGLGYEFLGELDKSLRLIASFPELQPLADKKIRRCLVNRFPYGIFYGVAEPDYWKSRT